jgi:hypothetical protein
MTRNKLQDYIKKRSTEVIIEGPEGREYSLFNRIPVFVLKPLTNDVELTKVLQSVENTVPDELTSAVETIYIGYFPEIESREVASLWSEGAIYVTNEQDSEEDLLDDIVHEFAHAVEDTYGFEIYADDAIEREFLEKRRHMYQILSAEGYNMPIEAYMSTVYNKEFDEFLYKEVTYERLTFLTMGLFISPYGSTSLREYFANAFEEYFISSGDRDSVRTISPAIYRKINQIMEQNYE